MEKKSYVRKRVKSKARFVVDPLILEELRQFVSASLASSEKIENPDAQMNQCRNKRIQIHRTQPLNSIEKLPRDLVMGRKARVVSSSSEIK